MKWTAVGARHWSHGTETKPLASDDIRGSDLPLDNDPSCHNAKSEINIKGWNISRQQMKIFVMFITNVADRKINLMDLRTARVAFTCYMMWSQNSGINHDWKSWRFLGFALAKSLNVIFREYLCQVQSKCHDNEGQFVTESFAKAHCTVYIPFSPVTKKFKHCQLGIGSINSILFIL